MLATITEGVAVRAAWQLLQLCAAAIIINKASVAVQPPCAQPLLWCEANTFIVAVNKGYSGGGC